MSRQLRFQMLIDGANIVHYMSTSDYADHMKVFASVWTDEKTLCNIEIKLMRYLYNEGRGFHIGGYCPDCERLKRITERLMG